MEILPEWAPGWHPLIIHFPVALLSLAAGATVLEVFYRPGWLSKAILALYALGTAAAAVAYLTGRSAAESIGLNLRAEAAISTHSDWGLYTLLTFIGMSALYYLAVFFFKWNKMPVRLVLAVLALAGFFVLAQTAEYGGRLVFEFGLGVQQ